MIDQCWLCQRWFDDRSYQLQAISREDAAAVMAFLGSELGSIKIDGNTYKLFTPNFFKDFYFMDLYGLSLDVRE